jgi:hypothetical protein
MVIGQSRHINTNRSEKRKIRKKKSKRIRRMFRKKVSEKGQSSEKRRS